MKTGKKKSVKDLRLEYGKVVERAELVSVRLLSLHFEVQPVFFVEREKADLGYEIKVDASEYDTEARTAAAFIDCSVSANIDAVSAFDCSARYMVVYDIHEQCDGDAVQEFLRRVAVFACYPYFRSVVATVDWSAGTALPPMPVHRESRNKAEIASKEGKI